MAVAMPNPDFDFEDDDNDDIDDDDDHLFRFGQNGLRRNSFQPSFRFNSFDQSRRFQHQQPLSFQEHQPSFQQRRSFQTPFVQQQQTQSFNSFRPSLRECWPPPVPLSAGAGGVSRHELGSNTHPILTIVRFAPFSLIRPSETAPAKLFLYVSDGTIHSSLALFTDSRKMHS